MLCSAWFWLYSRQGNSNITCVMKKLDWLWPLSIMILLVCFVARPRNEAGLQMTFPDDKYLQAGLLKHATNGIVNIQMYTPSGSRSVGADHPEYGSMVSRALWESSGTADYSRRDQSRGLPEALQSARALSSYRTAQARQEALLSSGKGRGWLKSQIDSAAAQRAAQWEEYSPFDFDGISTRDDDDRGFFSDLDPFAEISP